ncbi:MAG TPA: ATPase, T2SS/T4P/T4SS family [Acidimicrobiia bacterium]|nr:ATPase, T2SS/T4P/T4SS family [Acidimicrobiia bacterium]
MSVVLDAGALDALLADPEVSEILLNGGGRAFVERAGRLEAVPVDLDESGVRRMVERVIAPLGLRLDRASPMVDARLPDGSRLHAVLPPVAVDGTCVAIRRFGAGRRELGDFFPGDTPEPPDSLTAPGAGLLRWAVGAGWNLLLSGGTGAGKTTLLNVLAREVAPAERIVTIEETAELALGQPHVVRLEARAANAEGAGAVPVRALVRAALRLRPDRLVVGEVRGEEAFDLLQALNTGHSGSLCTIHANGPGEALARLESLVLLAGVGLPVDAIRAQIRASVDAVVHVARHPGGQRAIEAIAELSGPTGLRRLYPPGSGAGAPARPPRLAQVPPFHPRLPIGRPGGQR